MAKTKIEPFNVRLNLRTEEAIEVREYFEKKKKDDNRRTYQDVLYSLVKDAMKADKDEIAEYAKYVVEHFHNHPGEMVPLAGFVKVDGTINGDPWCGISINTDSITHETKTV